MIQPSSGEEANETNRVENEEEEEEEEEEVEDGLLRGSSLSVAILLTGIMLARFGLWNLDLTITQILQVSI